MKKIVFLLLATTSMMFAQSGSELVKTTEKVKELTEKGLSNVNNVSVNVKEASNNTKEVVKATSNAVGTAYQDGKSATSTVYSDGKDIVKQLYEDSKHLGGKLEGAISYVAEGLKTTSIKAWEILVKQQLVWSYCFLFLTLLSLYSIYRFFNQWKIMNSDLDESGDVKQSHIALTFVLGVVAVVSSITSGIHFEQMITGFVNPEFGALRTLFEIIQQNIK
jgi:gas vesicle protein